jgi:AcrR family transcriptional regulator
MAYQRTPYVESKRAEARQRLVEAAVGLVEQGGWREVQMSAVAAAAGLSTGAVYLHFPSKTQLLIEVYQVQAGAELRVVSGIVAQPVPATERLEAAVNAFAQRAMSNRRLAYAMVLEPTENEVEEERLRFHAEFIAQFRRILDDGVAHGEFVIADTQVAAACIFGGITESLMNPLGTVARAAAAKSAAARSRDAAELVSGVMAFCFHGVGKPAPARRQPARSGPAPARPARKTKA